MVVRPFTRHASLRHTVVIMVRLSRNEIPGMPKKTGMCVSTLVSLVSRPQAGTVPRSPFRKSHYCVRGNHLFTLAPRAPIYTPRTLCNDRRLNPFPRKSLTLLCAGRQPAHTYLHHALKFSDCRLNHFRAHNYYCLRGDNLLILVHAPCTILTVSYTHLTLPTIYSV